PDRQLFDAVFDAERPLGAAHLDAPPASQARRGVAAVAEKVPRATVDKAHMDAGLGKEVFAGRLPKGRPPKEGLDLHDVTAEVAHDAEGMREERLRVEVRVVLKPRVFGRPSVKRLATRKAHLHQAVAQLAQLARLDQTLGFFGWR